MEDLTQNQQQALEREVIRECFKRGLKRSKYYLGAVHPYDHDGEIERSLYEFELVKE
jgi:hypothetical protein